MGGVDQMSIDVAVDMLFLFSEEQYKEMEDRFYSNLQETGRCAVFIWGEVYRHILAQNRQGKSRSFN